MPEIGEVARVVHYLRKHLVNRTIKSVQAFEDDIVYGKVGCSAIAFKRAVEGKKVTGAGQQGKYFYLTFDAPPHSVMHLGMTGWVKFNAEETYYYKQAKENKQTEEWPPKYMKFLLQCDAEEVAGEEREPVEVAFVDARRLARIRLVECEASAIRKTSPLKENGPDPVIDKDVLTVNFLKELMRRKKVPIKALLLDQGNISGVGNWVADEVLFGARIHPEQYSNTFNDAQIEQLHHSLMDVCTTACELLADSSRFPANWLMKYRWDKGKKDANVLPTGEKIVHLKVGGRTSAIVPSLQKKTAAVAGDVEPSELEEEEGQNSRTNGRKRKANETVDQENDYIESDGKQSAKVKVEQRTKRGRKSGTRAELGENERTEVTTSKTMKSEPAKEEPSSAKQRSTNNKAPPNGSSRRKSMARQVEEPPARISRSSARTKSRANV